ncbi:MAG TPA: hypothetical protein VHG89_04705 [Verrucomicrobiae bacterium]|nr:hypothetical protein [Verrucomicrobiae bacterium]
MKRIIAIDPGADGGLAWSKFGHAYCCRMPATLGDLVAALRALYAAGYQTAVVEKVVGFIPGGGAGAMFSFGQNFGQIQGALQGLLFRVIEVRPQEWQKALQLGDKGSQSQGQWKNKLKAEAQRRFPEIEVTLKTADALLLLDYARNHARL